MFQNHTWLRMLPHCLQSRFAERAVGSLLNLWSAARSPAGWPWRRPAALVGSLLLGIALSLLPLAPATAMVRQIEEAPGQVVYQSRETLQDQHGNRWQAIAFKRQRPEGPSHFYLRLVGFPGAAVIDRTQALQLTNPLGETLTATDASGKIFTDEKNPEPHIGQYDLQPLADRLQAELPLQLTIPVEAGEPVRLAIAPLVIEEWLEVAAMVAAD